MEFFGVFNFSTSNLYKLIWKKKLLLFLSKLLMPFYKISLQCLFSVTSTKLPESI